MNDGNRTYSDLVELPTFRQRFEYLALRGKVGNQTFGSDRWMNQKFYSSSDWKRLRDLVIIRDGACDLGIEGREIHDRLLVHHMNPISQEDIAYGTRFALDPEFLICVTHETHNAIHYGDASLLIEDYIPRRPGDTKLW